MKKNSFVSVFFPCFSLCFLSHPDENHALKSIQVYIYLHSVIFCFTLIGMEHNFPHSNPYNSSVPQRPSTVCKWHSWGYLRTKRTSKVNVHNKKNQSETYIRIFRYVCFVPAKRLIRGLSANSSSMAFVVPLALKWWQSGLESHKDSQLRNMAFIFSNV